VYSGAAAQSKSSDEMCGIWHPLRSLVFLCVTPSTKRARPPPRPSANAARISHKTLYVAWILSIFSTHGCRTAKVGIIWMAEPSLLSNLIRFTNSSVRTSILCSVSWVRRLFDTRCAANLPAMLKFPQLLSRSPRSTTEQCGQPRGHFSCHV
jgi:hypothetical protein